MIPGLPSVRGSELFAQRQTELYRRTDRLFAFLMMSQWLAALGCALWLSPRTWAGAASTVHPHVWLALFFGGCITLAPVLLAFVQPGRALTRHVVAAGQVLMSALLIHLTGGRLETHFHIFGSLAFLAFYRDFRVLLTATVFVAADHFWRGAVWPQSIYGIAASTSWRWLEHAGWVLFEDAFLFVAIRQSVAEMRGVAVRQSQLEEMNTEIERQVQERTRELAHENAERLAAERALREVSRQAGMAEVATSVLHNVGNVLNSVNVSIGVAAEKVGKLKVGALGKLAGILHEHRDDLPGFVATHPQGARLPGFVTQMAEYFAAEQKAVLGEFELLRRNVDHVNEIVAMQQSYATGGGVVETMPVEDVIEDALRMNAGALARHGSRVVRDFDGAIPPLPLDRNKILMILVNLIRNAKYACDDGAQTDKCITLRTRLEGGTLNISVSDNGIGIPAENLQRIFEHGFTTRENGHGFGLHSSGLAAGEMGGALRTHSDGPGRGATFTLELPTTSPHP